MYQFFVFPPIVMNVTFLENVMPWHIKVTMFQVQKHVLATVQWVRNALEALLIQINSFVPYTIPIIVPLILTIARKKCALRVTKNVFTVSKNHRREGTKQTYTPPEHPSWLLMNTIVGSEPEMTFQLFCLSICIAQ